MRWSLKLGRLAGIDVYVHATFSLLILWVGVGAWLRSHSVPVTLREVSFILLLFLCIVLHELGHALMARRYGVRTRDITLLPFGGMARLERMPEKPSQEFWIAVAGPAVNVVIALALALGLGWQGELFNEASYDLASGGFVHRLMLVNVMLVAFNMLPAFPMDGGRVLRAFLASRMSYARATRVAASVGQGMALLFGFLGFLSGFNPFLLLIAFVVWIGAAQESQSAELRAGLGGVRVCDAMLTEFRQLSPDQTLQDAVNLILAGSQHDFPVTTDGRVLGMLTREDLMKSLAQKATSTPVSEVMRRDIAPVPGDALVLEMLPTFQASPSQAVPVLVEGRLAGLLTSDNIAEVLMIRSALKPS